MIVSHSTTGDQDEIAKGERFGFGENWRRFLEVLNDERIARAEESLREMLGEGALEDRTFLDIGSGSGLFSLAARNLCARVSSFDYDRQSVACTKELRRRYHPKDTDWTVNEGSVLDRSYVEKLGLYDIVYSWGVLHHTGAMWTGLENADIPVKSGGLLFIAIYNDQGPTSKRWLAVKKAYNALPGFLRFLVLWPAFVRLWGVTFVREFLDGRPFESWKNYGSIRGMSAWRDVVDWVGGYPFEVASTSEIISFYEKMGYTLINVKDCAGGLGCNEFVFRKEGVFPEA